MPGHRRLLPTVFLATFFIRFGFGITTSVFFFYLGSNVETVGLAAAAAPAIEFSTVLLSGMASDRYGRFVVLQGGLLLGAGLLVLMSMTREALFQTLMNGFFGLSSGAILAASLAIIGDTSGRGERGLEMGRFDAANLFGWIAGFAFGYITVSAVQGQKFPDHLRVAFLVGAVMVMVALALVFYETRGLWEVGRPEVFSRERLREAILDPDILLVVLPWATIYMLLGALFTFLGSAADSLKVPLWELGGVIAVGGSILLLTQPFYGKLADRWGRTPVMAIGVLGFLGVLAAGGWIAVRGFDLVALGGIVVSAVAALAFGPSSLAALTDLSRRITRGTTMALYSMMIAIGMALGLLLSSGLYVLLGNRGVAVFFGIVAAFLITLTVLRLAREHRSRAGPKAVAATE